ADVLGRRAVGPPKFGCLARAQPPPAKFYGFLISLVGNFDRDQSAMKRGCMITGSDRASLVLGNPRGRCASLPPHSGSTAPRCSSKATVWGSKAKPPVLQHFPRRLCSDADACWECGYGWSCEVVAYAAAGY